MKVRISIPGAYMVKDMPEDKAWETFGKLAEMILIISRKDKEEEGGAGLDTNSSDADPQVSVRVPGMEIHETEGMQMRPPWTLRKAGRGRNIRDSCTFDAQNAGKRRVFLPDRKQIIIIVMPVEPVGFLKSP